jgi:hypothetical protein
LIEGGDKNSELLGKNIGEVVWQVAGIATGVGGAAKGSITLSKIGINLGKETVEKLAEKWNPVKLSELKNGSTGIADVLLPEANFAGEYVPRSDLVEHLSEATKLGSQISGGHDMLEFDKLIKELGGAYTKKEIAPGIYECNILLSRISRLRSRLFMTQEFIRIFLR